MEVFGFQLGNSTKSKASVSKKRKITALYVAKVIYNAVIFMI